jgi:hypothetical protein
VGGVPGPVVQPDALIVGCRDTHGRLRVSGAYDAAVLVGPLDYDERSPAAKGFALLSAHHPSSRLARCPANPSPTQR